MLGSQAVVVDSAESFSYQWDLMSSANLISLDRISLRESVTVCEIDGDDDVWLRLLEMGILPGTTICVVKRAPLGDPLELRVRDQHLSLRKSEASRVKVTRSTSEVEHDT